MTEQEIKGVAGKLCGEFPLSKKARIAIEEQMKFIHNNAIQEAADKAREMLDAYKRGDDIHLVSEFESLKIN